MLTRDKTSGKLKHGMPGWLRVAAGVLGLAFLGVGGAALLLGWPLDLAKGAVAVSAVVLGGGLLASACSGEGSPPVL